jgi:hypothetical protein
VKNCRAPDSKGLETLRNQHREKSGDVTHTIEGRRAVLAAAMASSCGLAPTPSSTDDATAVQASALTTAQRLTACAQDPRVVTGLASKEICAGAGIFFEEMRGRCQVCHLNGGANF